MGLTCLSGEIRIFWLYDPSSYLNTITTREWLGQNISKIFVSINLVNNYYIVSHAYPFLMKRDGLMLFLYLGLRKWGIPVYIFSIKENVLRSFSRYPNHSQLVSQWNDQICSYSQCYKFCPESWTFNCILPPRIPEY